MMMTMMLLMINWLVQQSTNYSIEIFLYYNRSEMHFEGL
jgi:hypothetical protein